MSNEELWQSIDDEIIFVPAAMIIVLVPVGLVPDVQGSENVQGR